MYWHLKCSHRQGLAYTWLYPADMQPFFAMRKSSLHLGNNTKVNCFDKLHFRFVLISVSNIYFNCLLNLFPNASKFSKVNPLKILIQGQLLTCDCTLSCTHSHSQAGSLGADIHNSESQSLCRYELLCISTHPGLSGGTHQSTMKPSLVSFNLQLLFLLLLSPLLPNPYCSLYLFFFWYASFLLYLHGGVLTFKWLYSKCL